MSTQYVKLYAWMTELGLSAAEIIVYAVVAAYTGFKGYFDGTGAWLSKWIGSSAGEASRVLESLSAKGLIYPGGRRSGVESFKSSVIEPPAPRGKGAKPGSLYLYNNIDNIDHIDNIDNKNNMDPIENNNKNNNIDPIEDPIERSKAPLSIEDPIPYEKKPRARTDGPEPIGRLIGDLVGKEPPAPSKAAPARQAEPPAPSKAAPARKTELTAAERGALLLKLPEVQALLEEYKGDITAIPLEKLMAATKDAVI